MTQRILYISGSIGLGHIWRDLEIAKELRRLRPDIDITWLSEYPAVQVLKDQGEKVLPDVDKMINTGSAAQDTLNGYELNLVRFSMKWTKIFPKNAQTVIDIIKRDNYDLVVGDENYDLIYTLTKHPEMKQFPYVLIYDFVGHRAVTHSPMEMLAARIINRFWIVSVRNSPRVVDRLLFVGVPEDVADERFGLLRPNKRELCKEHVDFLGYILPFDPGEYSDKAKMKNELGYSDGPLIVASIGGTSTGKLLLDLCNNTYPLLKKEIPELKMVLVCGPTLDPKEMSAVEGVTVRGYVPELYKHLAAADLCIGSGGGTTTMEMIALQKPFLYFPLEHYDEQRDVAERCERLGARNNMVFSQTTPEVLASKILGNIGARTDYRPVPLEGAKKAANIIIEQLDALSGHEK
jgi:predicted glycosyltransferase